MTEAASVAVDALGSAEVVDVSGKARKLGETWAERTALLVFIRHFG